MTAGAGIQRYTRTARVLHWVIAVLLVVQIPIGLVMNGIGPPLQNPLYAIHKAMGILLLLLIAARIAWRLSNKPPPLDELLPPLQRRGAAVVHVLLYVMLIVMVVSGYVLTVGGGYPVEVLNWLGVPPLMAKMEPVAKVAAGVHDIGKVLLIGLIIGHVAAALHHRFGGRREIFARMWPP